MSGALKPNFGGPEPVGWEETKKAFRGQEVWGFLEKLGKGEAVVSLKPQYVDALASGEDGEKTVEQFLGREGRVGELVEEL